MSGKRDLRKEGKSVVWWRMILLDTGAKAVKKELEEIKVTLHTMHLHAMQITDLFHYPMVKLKVFFFFFFERASNSSEVEIAKQCIKMFINGL